MKLSMLPLVNWEMGNILIGLFAVVCIVLVGVVYSLSQGDKNSTS
jgi:Na+-translocating ferredoxin:NAD+ oxidoreductase RnfG subunit